jgi:predicted DNA-binding transcriptional regulator AlpA
MYLTKQEVAAVLRVSVRTITTYMQQGAIPKPKKVGGILLWDEDELHRKIVFSSACETTQESVKRGRPRKVRFA